MSMSKARKRAGFGLVCWMALNAAVVHGQQDRIVRSIDAANAVQLKGNRSPRARLADDRGPVDPSARISAITLVLKSSPSQVSALEKLLEEQRNPASPSYRRWLNPEEYADRFGLSRNDFGKVVAWLQSQGFSVDYTARGRNWVGFSGTAREIRNTFQTEVHRYLAEGETHYANATDPAIPAALAPVVALVRGLDDFRLSPHARSARPHFTGPDGLHALMPNDLATIYDIAPLYQAGITGSGQQIVVVGQTGIVMTDIEEFRNAAGLSANDPKPQLVPGYPDPGVTQDQGEANLDLEFAGGMAPDATVRYIYSPDVMVSVQYAIDQAMMSVISMSYGGCEPMATSGPDGATAIRALAQQANSEGITWLASSGDCGSAACQTQGIDVASTTGMSVNLPASIPEVTGVGGAEFNEGSGSYWSDQNDAGHGSVLSYIPEMAWNDTPQDGTLASGGGGASIFFAKPAWQTGPGVPNDNARDVPDVAFAASWDHDAYAVVMNGNAGPSGGTSAATPVFAGILALLNQYLVSTGVINQPGLGNINPTLYSLAQSSTDIFHDITVGNNIVPCAAGSPGCDTGSYGFSAGPGYDQATGLGSIDVYNLAHEWTGTPASGCTTGGTLATTTTLVAAPATLAAGDTTTITVTVTPACGTAWPEGSVDFIVGGTDLGSANVVLPEGPPPPPCCSTEANWPSGRTP